MNSNGNNPATSLREEQKIANGLLDLLKKEQDQLIAANIDSLVELTEEKSKLVSQLSELSSHRHRALTNAGFEPKESGMQAWIERNKDSTVSQTWKELLATIQSAKELNRVNGVLIQKHMARNQNALNVLKSGGEAQTFYGPNGQSSTKTTVRGLVVG